jgi:hypothetical protein
MVNCVFNLTLTALYVGGYTQGYTVTGCNFTGNSYGVYVPGSLAGALDQLIISGCQFYNGTDIYIGTTVLDVLISHNYFVVVGSQTGVNVAAALWGLAIVGNVFNCSSTAVAVAVGAVAVLSSTIAGNAIRGATTAVSIGNAGHGLQIENNSMSANTADYTVNASATGVVINDANPRTIATLPTAIAGIAGSRCIVSNGASPTYGGAVGTTGSVYSPAFCPGSGGWVYR